MIFEHCLFFTFHNIWIGVIGVFMPWFFFKSGMMFKPSNLKNSIVKDYGKYIKPFIIYSAFGYIVWAIINLIEHNLSYKGILLSPFISMVKYGNVLGNGALWFLITIFIVRLIANIPFMSKGNSLLISIVSYAIGYSLYLLGWQNYSWWFGNIFTGLSFFYLGIFFRERQNSLLMIMLSLIFYVVILMLWVFNVIDFPYLYMHNNTMHTGNYILFFPVTLSSIIIINNFFKYTQSFLKYSVLNYIGRNSMFLYVIHWILLMILLFAAKTIVHCNNTLIEFVVLVVGSAFLLPLLTWTANIFIHHSNN